MRVVRAASRVDGRIWSIDPPGRHPDIIRRYIQETGESYMPHGAPRACQGFLTDAGTFVDRFQAAIIAFEAGQIPALKDELFSEDLW